MDQLQHEPDQAGTDMLGLLEAAWTEWGVLAGSGLDGMPPEDQPQGQPSESPQPAKRQRTASGALWDYPAEGIELAAGDEEWGSDGEAPARRKRKAGSNAPKPRKEATTKDEYWTEVRRSALQQVDPLWDGRTGQYSVVDAQRLSDELSNQYPDLFPAQPGLGRASLCIGLRVMLRDLGSQYWAPLLNL